MDKIELSKQVSKINLMQNKPMICINDMFICSVSYDILEFETDLIRTFLNIKKQGYTMFSINVEKIESLQII